MAKRIIPLEVKRTCVEMRKQGQDNSTIYNDYYTLAVDDPMSRKNFVTVLKRWSDREYPDDTTLYGGTYEGFTAHGATVQVAHDGKIIQAWIKQSANQVDPEEFLSALREMVEPYKYVKKQRDDASDMLEIPLFDMHWGIAYMNDYSGVLDEILDIIREHMWAKIVIPFGQDFFHNDSIVNGQTTKGTVIEKVDMRRAVKESQEFIYTIIDTALYFANEVNVIYSPGNHDRSISWMFTQVLLERYSDYVVDDSLEFRKCVTYGENSIMFVHGDSKRATAKNLAHIFPVKFPKEFAQATTREIHAGHLHHEAEADEFGVMVRRLSSGKPTDDWEDREDFVGSMKRFMLFRWSTKKLRAIYYV